MIRASLRSLIGLLDWTRARLQGVDFRTPVTIHAQSILLIITHSLTDCKKFKLKYYIFDNAVAAELYSAGRGGNLLQSVT